MKTHVYWVHTVHKHLFLVRQNAGEMGRPADGIPFSCIPSVDGQSTCSTALEICASHSHMSPCLQEETRMGLLKSPISFKLGSLIQTFIEIPSHINAMSLKQGIHQFWLQWQRNHNKREPMWFLPSEWQYILGLEGTIELHFPWWKPASAGEKLEKGPIKTSVGCRVYWFTCEATGG